MPSVLTTTLPQPTMSAMDILKNTIRQTSPVLFAIPMGTGSISMLFFAFPYGKGSQPMVILSLIFYILNIGLFVLFNALTIARYTIYPESLKPELRDAGSSLFFACYPMGATTILNVSIEVAYRYYGFGGKRFVYFIWVLWWLNVAISAVCLWGGTHLMITRHSHSLPSMTAAWILPVVTFTVAASTGALTSEILAPHSPHSALVTLTVSAFLVTTGFFLASMMLTVYIMRLVIHGFPPGLSILSVFLPLGVSAQSGYAVSLLGINFKRLFPITPSLSYFFLSTQTGDAISTFCAITAFLLWSWAVLWIGYAALGLTHILRRTRIEFKLTFWGLVFPNGVFANLTIHLGNVFDSGFYRVFGAIYSILTLLLWIFVSYHSIKSLPLLRIANTKQLVQENGDARSTSGSHYEKTLIDNNVPPS